MNKKSKTTEISGDKQLRAYATKIKKWLKTVEELHTAKFIFAISITRLTSIKSLCQDTVAAAQFALYIAKLVQEKMLTADCPERLTSEEWETHKALFAEAIALMEGDLANPDYAKKQNIQQIVKQIDDLQGDDYRQAHWTTVHWVRSGYLLKLEYALRCFGDRDYPYWAYMLARKYVERYESRYGTGIIPESVPMLLEVSEFWCQYYFGQSLSEKFPMQV
jgi:hypothetical protein